MFSDFVYQKIKSCEKLCVNGIILMVLSNRFQELNGILITMAFKKTILSFCLLFIVMFPFVTEGKDLDQAIVHYNQGYDYYKKGEYEKAIDELTSSLKFDSDNENAHYGLGNCYYRKQMYEKATEGYLKSIAINPDFANAHYGLGTAYSALRKTDEADKEFTVYRKLKAGASQTEGSVSDTKKTSGSTKKSSKSSSSKRVRKERQSIKASKGKSKSKSAFNALSPKKNIKEILSVPGLKSPKVYLNSFKDMWSNSYFGKILIGIVGYIGITQVWLLLITFQGMALWKLKMRSNVKVSEETLSRDID